MRNMTTMAWIHCSTPLARLRHKLADKRGATAIEYALIAAGIAVAIIGAVFALGDELGNFFGDVQTELQNAGN